MYKSDKNHQFSLEDFDQPVGLNMTANNRWVKLAAIIPWDEIEGYYANLFPSNTGMPAKPLRVALGSLIIQKLIGFSDRELVRNLTENPYMQYFIGLPGYKVEEPFDPSLMVEFRKRLSPDIMLKINDIIADLMNNDRDNPDDPSGSDSSSQDKNPKQEGNPNRGTLMVDATCAPSNIKYPQDVQLLNESRLDLEKIIKFICQKNHCKCPRTYCQKARTDFMNYSKSKKHTKKRTHTAIKQQLQYVRRDLGYIDNLIEKYGELPEKQMKRLKTIREAYEQQKYMYENNVHTVENRIVSISQPYIRPIVRGKVKSPVEFGAKLDISLDEKGMARLEKLSFDAYNEQSVLIGAINRYKERTGHYPERVLVDKIYRTRKNIQFCTEHGIRISGPKLGRPKKDSQVDKKTEYQDCKDRIAIERAFALAKQRYGLDKIVTKLDETTRSSIILSVIVMNISKIMGIFLRQFLYTPFSGFIALFYQFKLMQNQQKKEKIHISSLQHKLIQTC